jgi:hypothetical protein
MNHQNPSQQENRSEVSQGIAPATDPPQAPSVEEPATLADEDDVFPGGYVYLDPMPSDD